MVAFKDSQCAEWNELTFRALKLQHCMHHLLSTHAPLAYGYRLPNASDFTHDGSDCQPLSVLRRPHSGRVVRKSTDRTPDPTGPGASFHSNGNPIKLHRITHSTDNVLPDAELLEMIERADTDQDGEINAEEFYSIMTKKTFT